MKTTSFFSRAALAALALGATSMVASAAQTQNVIVHLDNQDFGNENSLTATSDGQLLAVDNYYYRLTGTVHGTGQYAPFVPMGTDINALLDDIQAGASKSLTATKANPGGALPFPMMYNRTFMGSSNGAMFSLTIKLSIDAGGTATFEITNVSVTFFGQPVAGTVVFEPGAQLAMGQTPKVKMTVGTKMVGEGVPTHEVVVKVDKTVNPGALAKVHYATADGTALAGSDYTAKSGDLTFAAGVSSQLIHIPITNDAAHELAEKFKVNLSMPTAALLGAIKTTVVTIKAND